MMPIDTVLIRHGQSEGNLAKRLSEKGDHSAYTDEFRGRHSSSFHLTELGVKQARLIGDLVRSRFFHLEKGGFDRYLTSEYFRAIETAGYMDLPGAKWFPDPYLSERDWGEMDVRPEHEREELFGDAMRRRTVQPFFWRPPGGETFMDLCLRIDRVLTTLHRECSDKKVIIVCHGEVIRAFQIRLERMTQIRFRELTFTDNQDERIHNCQMVHYTRRDPESGKLCKYANWVQSTRASDSGPPWETGWGKIIRPSYSNEQLLALTRGS